MEDDYVKARHLHNFVGQLRFPNGTIQETLFASRSDCEHEDSEIVVDGRASLHVMSNHSLASDEKRYHQKIKRTHRNDTTATRKAQSPGEAAAYVNGMDFC